MAHDFTKYVHEFVDDKGVIRYGVAKWEESTGQFICPLDKRTAKLTGCFAEFARSIKGLGGYTSRAQALRRARYLFGDSERDTF
jgi:hypothetical protein